MKAPAVDTTVWIENGLYWFFVTLQEPRGDGLQLWLFHSRSLTGEWIRHPRNPISTDIRCSRGAGAIYREDGKLIRPSQDCSGNYGRRTRVQRDTVLNEREYSERPGAAIDPRGVGNIIGTHSYGKVKDVVVVDGCIPTPETGSVAQFQNYVVPRVWESRQAGVPALYLFVITSRLQSARDLLFRRSA